MNTTQLSFKLFTILVTSMMLNAFHAQDLLAKENYYTRDAQKATAIIKGFTALAAHYAHHKKHQSANILNLINHTTQIAHRVLSIINENSTSMAKNHELFQSISWITYDSFEILTIFKNYFSQSTNSQEEKLAEDSATQSNDLPANLPPELLDLLDEKENKDPAKKDSNVTLAFALLLPIIDSIVSYQIASNTNPSDHKKIRSLKDLSSMVRCIQELIKADQKALAKKSILLIGFMLNVFDLMGNTITFKKYVIWSDGVRFEYENEEELFEYCYQNGRPVAREHEYRYNAYIRKHKEKVFEYCYNNGKPGPHGFEYDYAEYLKKHDTGDRPSPQGNPTAPTEKDYQLLSLPNDADHAAVKQAYRKLAMRWHPDKNKDNEKAAAEQFKKITEAYNRIDNYFNRARPDIKDPAQGREKATPITTAPTHVDPNEVAEEQRKRDEQYQKEEQAKQTAACDLLGVVLTGNKERDYEAVKTAYNDKYEAGNIALKDAYNLLVVKLKPKKRP